MEIQSSHSLAIITSVFNNYKILTDFFSSLTKQTNTNFEVYLIDASDKNSKILKFPKTKVILSCNLGYAHYINEGLKQAKLDGYKQFCIVNSDIIFSNNFVENAISAITKKSGNIIGGKIYYAHGFEFHKKYSIREMGKVLWYAGGALDWKNAFTKHRGVDKVDIGQYNKTSETEFITGCLMLLDSEVVQKTGYFNELYFLYYEDADYCEIAKRHKVKLYYEPSLIIWHKNAQSTGGSGSSFQKKYQERSRLIFGLKYAPLRTKLHLFKNYLLSFLFQKR